MAPVGVHSSQSAASTARVKPKKKIFRHAVRPERSQTSQSARSVTALPHTEARSRSDELFNSLRERKLACVT